MTMKPFVGQSAIANSLLDLIYTDICGPLNTPARGGYSYLITFTNDHSRFGYVYLMRYKSEAFDRFKEYRLEVENQAGHKIKTLRLDRVGEYLMVLLEESSEEPQHDNATSFEPSVSTDGVPVLRRSTRESRPLERYGFIGLKSQLDNDPKTYGEAMSDIDSDKWLEAMKFEMALMGSNQVWTLVDPPKGVRPVGCKWVYKCKLGDKGEVTAFKARLMSKGYTQ
ncbi:UNVERIFIED_CONTAM: Retrovirus-related Pol polyprotein from transposon TNT 1-94 [Sesamum radiatum]|uniref:Retrovirus-related Pol polyprotein from transposon TNT 1-94 n=1 Tax=Sesamum radiatum TaxID=300843 RepID=A0AAW2PH76_SESRA